MASFTVSVASTVHKKSNEMPITRDNNSLLFFQIFMKRGKGGWGGENFFSKFHSKILVRYTKNFQKF